MLRTFWLPAQNRFPQKIMPLPREHISGLKRLEDFLVFKSEAVGSKAIFIAHARNLLTDFPNVPNLIFPP